LSANDARASPTGSMKPGASHVLAEFTQRNDRGQFGTRHMTAAILRRR
jgi:hypothetical protein